jgi:hypothetical protein
LKKEKSEPRQVRLVKDYARVFAGEEGKRVLRDLMRHGNMLGSSFNPDPYKTAFNEGQRNLVLYILHILQIDLAELQERMEQHEDSI